MKTKSMVLKAQELTPKELEIIEGGVNESDVDKTYDGGTLEEIICTPKDN